MDSPCFGRGAMFFKPSILVLLFDLNSQDSLVVPKKGASGIGFSNSLLSCL
uniref:Uncharacterized protein n=1 Tax=Utricularia reniformis TaxID=192314 RepID=A0A1Y0AZL1_9LAMI|nr:hypothetical protein AEK19_MT0305 [Utricularia reniformis]ART30580.1 hypothetical protein AEK19_MT0305 [Utricularia reniformis]